MDSRRNRDQGRDRDNFRDRRDYHDRRDNRRGGKGSLQWSGNKEQQELTETERLGELIVRIGEKPERLERNLQGLCNTLQSELGKFKTVTLDYIFKCALHLPPKIPIYATLIGLLNAYDSTIGAEVVERINEELQVALRHNEIYSTKYLVRFLADLVNAKVVDPNNLFVLFNRLLSDDDTVPQGRRDFFAFAVMDTLPFVGGVLTKLDPIKMDELLNTLKNRAEIRDLTGNISANIFGNSDEAPEPLILWYYNALKEHAVAGWPQICLSTPHVLLSEQLSKGKVHSFPSDGIELPPVVPVETRSFSYPGPRNVFRLFPGDNNQMWVARNISKVDRYILEESIRGLLHTNYSAPKECVRLIQIIPSNLQFDQILDIFADVMFSELLFLPCFPVPVSRVLCVGFILSEFCKQVRDHIPGILAKSVQVLFNRVADLDVECVYILTEWFSHHLSNFDYKWAWSHWLESSHPLQLRFIADVLERCVRLAYFERIERAIPRELVRKLPDKPRNNFKYLEGPQVEGYRPAQILVNFLQQKHTSAQILTWFETEVIVKDLPALLKVDIFVTCLLGTSSKSFSHLLTSIERYVPVLQKFICDLPSALQAITSAQIFWKFSAQRFIIVMSKLITYRIIPPPAVVEWIFSEEISKIAHEKYWIFELLLMTADQTVTTIELLHKKLSEMENPNHTDSSRARKEDVDAYKRTEDNLLAALQEQREFFLRVFQRFETLLKTLAEQLDLKKSTVSNNSESAEKKEHVNSDHPPMTETEEKKPEKPLDELQNLETRVNATLGLFHTFGRKYHKELRNLREMMDLLLSNTHPLVSASYAKFKSLGFNY